MADSTANPDEETKKGGKGGLVLAVALFVLGAGAGFGAAYAGFANALIGGSETPEPSSDPSTKNTYSTSVAFIPIDPFLVSIGNGLDGSHLRFTAQLEVPAAYRSEVENQLPRVVDVLNTYLRAVRKTDLQGPVALLRLRNQMLRRVQFIIGEEKVSDVLIMEFVLN